MPALITGDPLPFYSGVDSTLLYDSRTALGIQLLQISLLYLEINADYH